MGYDLCRGHDCWRFDVSAWQPVLDFAIEHGWQPAGTMAPDYRQLYGMEPAEADGLSRSWDGEYCSNDWQEVTDSDARALGEALLRGVAAAEAQELEKPTKWPDDWFRRVKKFADFALKGGFVIG
jgi:hypothetical protein